MKVGDLVRVVDGPACFMGMIGLVEEYVHEYRCGNFFRVLDIEDLNEVMDWYEWQLELISESR